MRRALPPALVAILLLAVGPFLGAFPAGILPSTPESALAFAAFALAAFLVVVLPSLRSATPARVVEAAVLGAPFLAALYFSSPAGNAIPWAALLSALALGLLTTALPMPWRSRIAILGALLLAAPALAASVGAEPPKTLLRPCAVPAPAADLPGVEAEEADWLPEAWSAALSKGTRWARAGALLRAPISGSPARLSPLSGAAFEPAPLCCDVSPVFRGPLLLVIGAEPSGKKALDLESEVETRISLPPHVLDLDPYDVLVPLVLPAEMEAGPADVLALFARRGGLLVLPRHPVALPEALARRLGSAVGIAKAGDDAARSFGLGRVARAAGASDVRALLDAGLAEPRAGTAFDRATSPPSAPSAFPRWTDDAGSRRGGFVLLVVFGAAISLAGLSRGATRAAGFSLLAALGVFGASLASVPPREVVVTPFAIDLGGLGGRRVEGLFVAAGPRGYAVPAGLTSEAGLRALGFLNRRIDGVARLVLRPGGEGWIVEESIARGRAEGAVPADRLPEWAEGLVRWGLKGANGAKFAAGNAPYGGPRPGGLGEGMTAATVVVTPGRP